MTQPINLVGVPGSPYTRKMLALLRYRTIDYRVIWGGAELPAGLRDIPKPKISLIPVFFLPNEAGDLESVTDSSPILRRLEKSHAGQSVIPTHPALAFLNELIEDYADEWLTKAMFHYRWHYAPDIEKAKTILPLYHNINAAAEALAPVSDSIAERQIERLSYVGSNEVTKPTIENSFRRFLSLFDAHLQIAGFVLGTRPASADFAIYGQLTQLALFDPTSRDLILQEFPRIAAWVDLVEDLSGLDADAAAWFEADALPDTLCALLSEIGDLYLPYLQANAAAVANGDAMMETELDGRAWSQNPFPYQAKCLHWLKQSFAALSDADQALIAAAAGDSRLIAELEG